MSISKLVVVIIPMVQPEQAQSLEVRNVTIFWAAWVRELLLNCYPSAIHHLSKKKTMFLNDNCCSHIHNAHTVYKTALSEMPWWQKLKVFLLASQPSLACGDAYATKISIACPRHNSGSDKHTPIVTPSLKTMQIWAHQARSNFKRLGHHGRRDAFQETFHMKFPWLKVVFFSKS